jgi:3-dehydroquinate dehydratase II
MAQQLLVIHGPNLNMLGKREPEKYGSTTLANIDRQLQDKAQQGSIALTSFQSNAEEAIVSKIQDSHNQVDFIIINAAAFTHTSVAIRDALLAVKIPFIEVHLTNIYSRDIFRHKSMLADVARGVICGFGANSYLYALDEAIEYVRKH